jgi:hypothetical protein
MVGTMEEIVEPLAPSLSPPGGERVVRAKRDWVRGVEFSTKPGCSFLWMAE